MLAGVQEVPQDEGFDNTPTGALKRLEGSVNSKVSIPIVEVEEPPITPVAQLTRSYKRIEPKIESVKQPLPEVQPMSATDLRLESLMSILSTLPFDKILPALDAGSRVAKEEQARRDLVGQKQAIEKILRDAESRAEDREIRLQSMLREVS
jgi:hypothetical protein